MTITKEGALASFYTVNKAPIKHLRVYFSPKQAGEGDPSPENVREITGWTGVEVTRCGKNLYNPDSAWQKKGRLFKRFINHVECCTSFTVKDDSLTNNVYFGYAYTSENIELGYNWMIENGVISSKSKVNRVRSSSLTNPEGVGALCDYFTIYPGTDAAINQLNAKWQIQTELGTTPTAYEPYQGQTLTLDWTEAGTVYGGYVDLVTGELVQEYEFASLTWGQAVYSDVNETTGYQWGSVPFSNPIIVAGETGHQHSSYCNIGQYSWSGANKAFSHFYTDYSDSLKTFLARVIVPSTTDSNLTINCVAKLKTPIIHQLTPQQLETFIGHNNIWSNADRVEIEYDLAESNDELYRRRNIILRSSPHIETVAGSIANFNTDIAAPLKECKIYFTPVQEGEGDPSPDNLRPIRGWENLEITRCGKNFSTAATGTEMVQKWSVNNNASRELLFTGMQPGQEFTLSASFTKASESNPNKRLYLNGSQKVNSTTNSIFQGPSADGPRDAVIHNWVDTDGTIKITHNNRGLTYNDDFIEYAASLQNIQLELGDTATAFEPYNGITIPITFPSEAGTVYGGYIDLKTGEIWKTYDLVEIAKRTWNNYSGFLRWYINLQDRKNGGAIIADSVTPDPSGRFTEAHVGELTYYGEPRSSFSGYMWLTTPTVMTHEEANEWIRETYNDATAVYELSAPRLVATLTPTQLKTLRGTNNIWSNANGNIQLSYWKH